MNEIALKIEAILFLSARPVSFNKLAKVLDLKEAEIQKGLEELKALRNNSGSGIHLVVGEGAAELASNPQYSELLTSLSKEETESELTRPQLETLTIIAYRGPVTKAEIEHIRGVNCTIILRNLLMRGLVVEKGSDVRLNKSYIISTEMLRHLGLHDVQELPDYKDLHTHAKISEMLETLFQQAE